MGVTMRVSVSGSECILGEQMLQIEAIAAFRDNYIWLLKRPNASAVAVVDPGCAASVLRHIKAQGQVLTDILVTHHHADHVGGIEALQQQYPEVRVWGPKSITLCNRPVGAGDAVILFGESMRVLSTPGHTLDHLCYWCESGAQLFCGDTLFAGGCGRLFEGTPEQMLASLEQLAALPEHTQCYCAHEYTLSNLTFAVQVEPDNAVLQARYQQVQQWRAQQRMTVPFTLRQERATNPFLRCEEAAVIAAASDYAGRSLREKTAVFAELRQWKNTA